MINMSFTSYSLGQYAGWMWVVMGDRDQIRAVLSLLTQQTHMGDMQDISIICIHKCWKVQDAFFQWKEARTRVLRGVLNSSLNAPPSFRSDKPPNLLCLISWTACCCHNSINSTRSLYSLVFSFLPAPHHHANSYGVSPISPRASRM